MRSSVCKRIGPNGECVFDTEVHVTATDAMWILPRTEYLLSLRDSKHISSTKGPNGATSCWLSKFTTHHHLYVDS